MKNSVGKLDKFVRVKMTDNNNLLEGFWDTVITKAKQGALAVAGAAGSSTAKGKLSASLLSDAIYSQYKEWNASTGSDVNPIDFHKFLQGMGFSTDFAERESDQLATFIGSTPSTDTQSTDAPPSNSTGSDEQPPPEPSGTNRPPLGNKQRIKRARMNGKRGRRPTRESLDEGVVSDGELRKFFNSLAQRALKSGEAKSAAKKTMGITRTANQSAPPAASPAPATGDTPPASPQAAPTASQETPAPAAAQTSSPAATNLPPQAFTDSEKEVMNAFPAGTNLGSQIKATSPELQALAQKIMQDAFNQYKQNGGSQAQAKPKPANKR